MNQNTTPDVNTWHNHKKVPLGIKRADMMHVSVKLTLLKVEMIQKRCWTGIQVESWGCWPCWFEAELHFRVWPLIPLQLHCPLHWFVDIARITSILLQLYPTHRRAHCRIHPLPKEGFGFLFHLWGQRHEFNKSTPACNKSKFQTLFIYLFLLFPYIFIWF